MNATNIEHKHTKQLQRERESDRVREKDGEKENNTDRQRHHKKVHSVATSSPFCQPSAFLFRVMCFFFREGAA